MTISPPKRPTLNHARTRKGLRKKNITVFKFLLPAKIYAFFRSRIDMEVIWVFAEPYGFVVINHEQAEIISKARMKNNLKKLHVRDLNRMCVFRAHKKVWGVIKKSK